MGSGRLEIAFPFLCSEHQQRSVYLFVYAFQLMYFCVQGCFIIYLSIYLLLLLETSLMVPDDYFL